MERATVFSGYYISQSGVKLEYTIEDAHINDKKEGRDYIVCFQNGAHSAGISKVNLDTYWVLKGKMFFISKSEFADLKDNVLGKTCKWTINDIKNNPVELPGSWIIQQE
jgi:hypothetical protein